MEFTYNSRRDVDTVERDFVDFKNANPEVLEFLVPTVLADREFIPEPLASRPLTSAELSQARKLGPWGYSFDFSHGVSTDQLDLDALSLAMKAETRGEYIIRMSMLRKILAEHPIQGPWIDLATNSGVVPIIFSSLSSHDITGIDISTDNIDKATFLKVLSGKEKINFIAQDIFETMDRSADNQFDFISALGIFYHLTDPLGLIKLMYQKSSRAVLIDTVIHNFPFSGWIQTISRHVKYAELGHANDTRKLVELHPTCRGLLDSLFQIGFRRVVEVLPDASLLLKYPGSIYDTKNRRIFIAFK